jgi:hypothetical protein
MPAGGLRENLQRLAGGAHEVAQRGDIGAVRADASGVNGQTELLGLIEVHSGVIQFRQTVASGGSDAVHARGIDRPRRAMTLPGAARQFVKLLPIAFVPIVHDPQYRDAIS